MTSDTQSITVDDYFPPLGPCGLCNSGADQRHRVIDAIAARYHAGEDTQDIAQDYGVAHDAVAAAVEYREAKRCD